MSIQIESDLKEILQSIEKKFDKIEQKLEKIDDQLVKIENSQARLEEKVEGLSKRIDNQEFVSRGVLIGLIVAIAGGAAKLFGFIGNP
jgi:predicted  nucleic acid-binding Zn-ribbon protein